jgi:hypothetical protein
MLAMGLSFHAAVSLPFSVGLIAPDGSVAQLRLGVALDELVGHDAERELPRFFGLGLALLLDLSRVDAGLGLALRCGGGFVRIGQGDGRPLAESEPGELAVHRVISTQDFPPLYETRSPKPGMFLSQYSIWPFGWRAMRSTIAAVRRFWGMAPSLR